MGSSAAYAGRAALEAATGQAKAPFIAADPEDELELGSTRDVSGTHAPY